MGGEAARDPKLRGELSFRRAGGLRSLCFGRRSVFSFLLVEVGDELLNEFDHLLGVFLLLDLSREFAPALVIVVRLAIGAHQYFSSFSPSRRRKLIPGVVQGSWRRESLQS